MNKQKIYQKQNWLLKNIKATKHNIELHKQRTEINHDIISAYKQDLRQLIEQLQYITNLINKQEKR